MSPVTTAIVLAIIVIVTAALFWKAAKGKPPHVAGMGRLGMSDQQSQPRGRR
jgi:hypothetical protein